MTSIRRHDAARPVPTARVQIVTPDLPSARRVAASVDAFLRDAGPAPDPLLATVLRSLVERSQTQPKVGLTSQIATLRAKLPGPLSRVAQEALARTPLPDHLAPDGTALHKLLPFGQGEIWQAVLKPGTVSHAVRHKQVAERWLFTAGAGELWLKRRDGHEDVVAVRSGTIVDIPPGVAFQFKSKGSAPLEFFGMTQPRFPGPQEAEPVEGRWSSTR